MSLFILGLFVWGEVFEVVVLNIWMFKICVLVFEVWNVIFFGVCVYLVFDRVFFWLVVRRVGGDGEGCWGWCYW